ncbi:hypothetical protein J4E91_000017 [Alternaria rosae]|nr:hypothetical protein J4E91_000017 [Alternaria rosae]
MSLQKLSTELDGHIASCLVGDTKALSAFSKTNKYYRGVAEPYLYTNIEVYEYDLEMPLRLLFTLLDRKELALYIRRLSYVPAQHRSSHDADTELPMRKKLQSDSDGKGPFQNIQRLLFNAGHSLMTSIVVLPTLRTLEYNIGSFNVDAQTTASMFAYPSPMPAQPVLRRIQFMTTRNITPAIIQTMVSDPAMGNLQELVIDDCGRSRRNLPIDMRGDNLVELLRSLEKYTPLLELLQWSNQKSDRQEGHPCFDTFKDLKHLRKLHIDYDLLVPQDDTNVTNLRCLSKPHAVFPLPLEDLTLDSIDIDKLHHLITSLHDSIEESDEMSETEALRASLASLAAMLAKESKAVQITSFAN